MIIIRRSVSFVRALRRRPTAGGKPERNSKTAIGRRDLGDQNKRAPTSGRAPHMRNRFRAAAVDNAVADDDIGGRAFVGR